jgi:hypothetical protein
VCHAFWRFVFSKQEGSTGKSSKHWQSNHVTAKHACTPKTNNNDIKQTQTPSSAHLHRRVELGDVLRR